MSDALRKAEEFLSREQAFRLGELVTEAFHPKTRTLSQTAVTDLPAAIRLLQSVDEDIPPAMEKVLRQDSFGQLVEAFGETMSTGKQIFFTGCGATGRLSILLEASWRRFWRQLKQAHPDIRNLENHVFSVMAGGDFALIKSVEGYEDFPDFGRYQLRERNVRPGDVVVAITEGGETPFVIGTAWEGLDAGANVFFVYNNPTELLCQHVKRSREVIEEPRITKLDLTTGPMAITGSTRLQATSAELFVVGSALEIALVRHLKQRETHDYLKPLSELIKKLSSSEAVGALARATKFEEKIYRHKGLVTYLADAFLLDVLTDTTERSPTFMLPPFRQCDDDRSPVSWAFVKDPFRTTEQTWYELLQHEPRGLDWERDIYEALKAPTNFQLKPPKLDNSEIYKFMIGNEYDPSRTEAPDSALVAIAVGDETSHLTNKALKEFGAHYEKTAALIVGSEGTVPGVDEIFRFAYNPPDSPLQLWHHLALKLILNTLSTATMVRMGRVIGNAMVWLSPSNKKLIDRGSRLIVQQTGCSYEQACIALHEAMEEVEAGQKKGCEVPSPVSLALEQFREDQSR